MSNNQKPLPSGGAPQQPRYNQGPYTTQRTDGFHVTATPPQGFVPQQGPSQPPNQGPGMRGMAPTGPPTQASTPPQSEIKVQQMQPQPGNMTMTYVSQAPTTVRGGQSGYFRQQTAAPRIQNHRPVFQQQPQLQMAYHPSQLNPASVVFSNQPVLQFGQGPRPQSFYAQAQYPPLLPNQTLYSAYSGQQHPTASYFYPQPPQGPPTSLNLGGRSGPPTPVVSAPQGPPQPVPQPMQAVAQPQPQPQPPQQPTKRRRACALTIIDPITGEDKSKEIYEGDKTPPPPPDPKGSSDPQQSSPTNMQVVAEFSRLVAQAATEGGEKKGGSAASEADNDLPSLTDIDPAVPSTSAQSDNTKPNKPIEITASESKLQPSTKEFVPEVTKTQAKEVTPVVSAISDAVEVTLGNKNDKRDSPAKGRKQRETNSQRETASSQRETVPAPLPQRESHVQRDIAAHQRASESMPREVQQSINNAVMQQPNVVVPQLSVHHQEHNVVPREVQAAAHAHVLLDAAVLQKDHQHSIAVAHKEVAAVREVPAQKETPVNNVAADVPNVPKSNKAANRMKQSEQRQMADQNKATVNNNNAVPPVENAQQGKQKQNASKAKEAAKPTVSNVSQPVVNQKPNVTAPPVPASQPSKSTNKTNKIREINRKGADKEGSDMDAFNTNDNSAVGAINNNNNSAAPAVAAVTENNTTVPAAPIATPPPPQQQKAAPVEKIVPETNNVMNKANVVKTLQKPKVDVTSIVKDVPRPITRPAAQPQQDAANKTNSVDKLVQAKNEVNNKPYVNDSNETPELKLTLRYKDNQWSPANPTGKKEYDRDFLMALQNDPRSKKKPENCKSPDLEIWLREPNTRPRLPESRSTFTTRQHDLLPGFAKSQSQRGSVTKRNSQQGNKAKTKSQQPNVIQFSLSLNQEVKLHETENAWKPARFVNKSELTEEEAKTNELVRKFRAILNKLTPQRFTTLVEQARSLEIDTLERLQGIIEIVFEKAVDEPNFSANYALLCREMALTEWTKDMATNIEGLIGPDAFNKIFNNLQVTGNNGEPTNFRKLLITRCQLHFEKSNVDETERNAKLKEIEKENDPDKKKELKLQLEDEDRRSRVRSVGNVRFIGELYKQNMLTTKIMLRCIRCLLEPIEEEGLECLCKLVSTVGKDLEMGKNEHLNPYFNMMQDIADRKRGHKISSRVRFMLQDVIDMRKNKWVPRRQDVNPKTIDQIQKEADTEQLHAQILNSAPLNTPRRDDRDRSMGGNDRRRRNVTDDGWTAAASRNNRTPYSVESSKLKNLNKSTTTDEVQLGSKTLFGQWGRGSNIKAQQSLVTNTTNMYAPLEHMPSEPERPRPMSMTLSTVRNENRARQNKKYKVDDRNGSHNNNDRSTRNENTRNGSKDPYNSKGSSMERSNYKPSYEDGRGSRSGSQARSREASTARQAPMPPPTTPARPVEPQLTPEQLENRIHSIFDEYATSCITLLECESEISTTFTGSTVHEFVLEIHNYVLEKSAEARQKAGQLFALLMGSGFLPPASYCTGLETFLEAADDLTIDIPKLWDYIAEMIVPPLVEKAISFSTLRRSFALLVSQGHAGKLLNSIFKQIVAAKGPQFARQLWKESDVSFQDFMPIDEVAGFIQQNQLEYLLSSAVIPATSSNLTFDQIRTHLLEFFKSKMEFDSITSWITANIGDKVNSKEFIRALMTAICEHAINRLPSGAYKLNLELLKNNYNLLLRYVDNKDTHELQVLYALQAYIHKIEHPQSVLFTISESLWEESIVSVEGFLAWEKSDDPAEREGKGVALKSLTSFFTILREGEDEEESSNSEAE